MRRWKKKWVLSGELPHISNFTFENDEDRFYNQHHPRQLANGNILLIDNGNARPGAATDAERWSRAIEYELDWERMVARAVWQFRAPFYSSHGGSVWDIPGSAEPPNRLVTFACDNALFLDDIDGPCVSLIYEARACDSANESQ